MPHATSSSEGITSVEICRTTIENLLLRAWEVKPDGGIEPALAQGHFADGIETLENLAVNGIPLNSQARSAAIETALREKFYGFLATKSIDRTAFSDVWNLLDICLIVSDNEYCETVLCFWLVEELLESQIISGCRRVFDYLESRREAMVAKHYKAKSLVILRACNELLKRLSRQEDTVFCGRVFIYLFQGLAFGDKSAVNLRGEFHVDNVTAYDQTPEDVTEDLTPMEVEPTQTQNTSSQANEQASITVTEPGQAETPISAPSISHSQPNENGSEQSPSLDTYTLYPIFWSLQDYFSKPTKLFESANLEAFKTGLEATLAKFKSVYKDLETRGSSATTGGEESRTTLKRKWEEEEDENIHSTISPKYLTSRDLFELEICDLAFRRHVLVQGLILIDFLLSQTPKAKRKLETLKNKSVIYGFVLDEKEAQWASQMRSQIASYLQQGTEGKFYFRMVDTVLSRDKNWAYWKAEGCPNISRPSITASEYLEARTGAQKASANKKLRAHPMGALDLSFLSESNSTDGLEKLKAAERYAIPALDTYRSAILGDEFDVEMAKTDEDKELASNARASKLWRTLRIASKKSKFNMFDKLDDGNKLDVLFQSPDEEEDGDQEEVEGEREGEVEGASSSAAEEAKAEIGSGDGGGDGAGNEHEAASQAKLAEAKAAEGEEDEEKKEDGEDRSEERADADDANNDADGTEATMGEEEEEEEGPSGSLRAAPHEEGPLKKAVEAQPMIAEARPVT